MKTSFEVGDLVWFIHWISGDRIEGKITGIGLERVCCTVETENGFPYYTTLGRLNHVR
jgi:hypothetical protein